MAGLSPFAVVMPVSRALSQLDDRAFLGVLVRSVAWSIICFAGLYAATIWLLHRLVDLHGILAWAADLLGAVGAVLLASWLFLPVAAAMGTLYLERIADAVERRFYPWLPPPSGASVAVQAWDGIVVALKVLSLNVLGLLLAFLIPGLGLIIGWMIAAYAIGRGLFVAVAMRRMPRPVAESLYHSYRLVILAQGGLMALAAYVPLINLLIPVIGTASMVHVVDLALSGTRQR